MTTTATQPAPATAAPRRNGGALPVRLIKSELLKIWTTNSWWIFGILLVAGTGLTLLINLVVANSQLAEAADLKARGLPNLEGIDASQQATDPGAVRDRLRRPPGPGQRLGERVHLGPVLRPALRHRCWAASS